MESLPSPLSDIGPMGDPEFVAAFYHLIVPIARQFGPDMVNY